MGAYGDGEFGGAVEVLDGRAGRGLLPLLGVVPVQGLAREQAPAQAGQRAGGARAPVRRARAMAPGVENQTVIRSEARNSGSARYARIGSGTTQPPAPQAQNRSKTAQSKVRSKVWEKTSSGPKS
ncbi:hypothetical protein GCM10020000_53120 [Streptomyces olivoverticillatus]